MTNSELATKNILIIDDFPDMRSVLKAILRLLGASRIEQAGDGDEALLMMKRRRFDIILCDYNLGPRKDGQQILEEARQKQLIGIDTIFLMITAENTREMVMGAVEYVPDGYLTKPVTKELLDTRLKRLMERKADLKDVNSALVARNYNRAISELDALIARRPKNIAELVRLRAEICIDARRLDEAMDIFQRALHERNLPWAQLGRAKVFFLQKRYDMALATLKELLDDDPNIIVAYDWLAKTYIALKNFESAEEVLAEAVRISPRAVKRQQNLGEIALNNKNHDVAEAALSKAVNLSQHSIHKHPALVAGLAKAKSANNKHDEAARLVHEMAKDFGSNNEVAFFQAATSAEIEHNRGNAEGARQAAAQAQKLLSGLGRAGSPSLSLELARIHSQIGDEEAAKSLLHKVIANNHDDDEFLHEVARVCRSDAMGGADPEGTIQEVRQEVIRTNNAGVQLIKQGKFDEAIALLRKAADDMPGNKTINLNAAKALIMKMEQSTPTVDEVSAVRQYVDRVEKLAAEDWRLAEVTGRLKKLSMRV